MNGSTEAMPKVSNSPPTIRMTEEQVEAAAFAGDEQIPELAECLDHHPTCPFAGVIPAAAKAGAGHGSGWGSRGVRRAASRGAPTQQGRWWKGWQAPTWPAGDRGKQQERRWTGAGPAPDIAAVEPGTGADVGHDHDGERAPDVDGSKHEKNPDPSEEISPAVAGRLLGETLLPHDPDAVHGKADAKKQQRRQAEAHRCRQIEIIYRSFARPGSHPFPEPDAEDRMANDLGAAVLENLGPTPTGRGIERQVLDHEADDPVLGDELDIDQHHGGGNDQHVPAVGEDLQSAVPSDQHQLHPERDVRR